MCRDRHPGIFPEALYMGVLGQTFPWLPPYYIAFYEYKIGMATWLLSDVVSFAGLGQAIVLACPASSMQPSPVKDIR